MRLNRLAAIAALSLALAGCVPAVAPQAGPAPIAPQAPPAYSMVGLGAVMGQTARAIEATFGEADLDMREGSARKLQFGNAVCVLDAYLYPPARGGEAVVTHVDARLPDGRDIDRASCVAALAQGRAAR